MLLNLKAQANKRHIHLKKDYLKYVDLLYLAYYEKSPIDNILLKCGVNLELFDNLLLKVSNVFPTLIVIKKREDSKFYVEGILNKNDIKQLSA